MHSDSVISIENLKKTFDGKEYVFDGLNVSFPRGKICVLIGFSGSGKSVMLKHILGLMRPSSGKIHVLDRDITSLNGKALTEFRLEFGVLFQDAALFDDMTALENVSFPLKEHRRHMTKEEIREHAQTRLKWVGLSPTSFDKLPSQLSGGMRKRVGLARALALDPKIMLYDEPTTGLDPIRTEMVDNLIVTTHKDHPGLSTIVVTHDLSAAFRFGEFIAMIHNGRMLLSGTPEDFLKSENDLVKKFIHKGVPRP